MMLSFDDTGGKKHLPRQAGTNYEGGHFTDHSHRFSTLKAKPYLMKTTSTVSPFIRSFENVNLARLRKTRKASPQLGQARKKLGHGLTRILLKTE
eukprot:6201465-Pleurochrysis_carterae.AAC.3